MTFGEAQDRTRGWVCRAGARRTRLGRETAGRGARAPRKTPHQLLEIKLNQTVQPEGSQIRSQSDKRGNVHPNPHPGHHRGGPAAAPLVHRRGVFQTMHLLRSHLFRVPTRRFGAEKTLSRGSPGKSPAPQTCVSFAFFLHVCLLFFYLKARGTGPALQGGLPP